MIARNKRTSIRTRTILAGAIIAACALATTTAFAQVYRVDGDFGAGFRYERRDYGSEWQTQMGYENFLRIGVDSWLFDPRFMTYNAWARVFWRDLYGASSTQIQPGVGYGGLWDDNQRYLDTDFNLRLTFFQKRPYVVQLYALRNSQNFDFQALPPSEIVTEAYGANLFLLLRGFAVNSTGEWRKARYVDYFNDYDYEAVSSSTYVDRTTDSQIVKIRHRYEQRQNLSQGYNYTDNNLYFLDDVTPSKTTRFFLQGGLRRFEAGAVAGNNNVTNTYTFGPSFQWKHDEWSIYEARSQFVYSELEGVTQITSNQLSADVLRQVKKGLWLKGGVGSFYSNRESLVAGGLSEEQTTENVFAGVNYTRLIRYYRATGTLDTSWGYTDRNPGEGGLAYNQAASAVLYDPHLASILWYVEVRGTYSVDETPDAMDTAVYYAKVNVRNKKPQALTYWIDAGFTDSYFYYPNARDINNRSVSGNASLGYALYPGHNLRGGVGFVHYLEPIERNLASASITYDANIRKQLTGRIAAQYYYSDPNGTDARSHIASQAEIRYKIRSLTLSGYYQLTYKQLDNSLEYTDQAVYIQAKRDFKAFWLHRPRPKMMKSMRMSR